MVEWVKTLSRVLYIDLTRKMCWVEDRTDLFEEWLGGIGVATQLYREEVSKEADPLGPENAVIFSVGPLSGLFPMASKTVAAFKSPLDGYFAESHAGGRSASAIRYAGYGAIVIKGASDRPVYLVVESEKTRFRDAGALWGMNSLSAGRVLREVTGGAGFRTIARIGRAGERLVHYACVTTETYRHFGRMGLGAVFGSKNLKALVIIGSGGFKLPNVRAYRETYRNLWELAVRSPVAKKYHDLGTAENVMPLNEIGALPTRNFSSGRFENAEDISGEEFARNVLARRVACSMCPVACIHVAAIREEYEDEKYFFKTEFVSYDYEPIYAVGSNLGICDRFGLLKIFHVLEAEGVDVISTGAVLAWCTEALEKGIISENETIIPLRWGDWKNYIKAIQYISEQANDFYKTAAKGVQALASKYGGRDFAVSFNNVEPAGYHTGPLFISSLIIGFRHSHLDSGAYSMDQKIIMSGGKLPSTSEAARIIREEEAWRQVLNSLVICLFARGLYGKENVVKALNSLDYNLSEDDLTRLAWKIYTTKNKQKIEEGFDPLGIKVPKRLLETPTPLGSINEQYIREVVEKIFDRIK
ncbi:MAG: aldehyde ferredoxin oxidoreductase N-terminal domain-containing protein [Nitrososphaerota archaeon]|nr:aldehyde:ferredoxin oxidoreductase [Candidatus Bathyarchaeota archaeon]MDW8049340.1 aldehyde ferredoxin oxidoreductase N-terminal domain-containing protein [Nitrososphaerota archaeon]